MTRSTTTGNYDDSIFACIWSPSIPSSYSRIRFSVAKMSEVIFEAARSDFLSSPISNAEGARMEHKVRF